MAFDTGGTMSDTFIIDEEGVFIVGKAQTTPDNESEGILDSVEDALEQWNIRYVLLVGGLKSIIYARPKDNTNLGARGWHIPVRYSRLSWRILGSIGRVIQKKARAPVSGRDGQSQLASLVSRPDCRSGALSLE